MATNRKRFTISLDDNTFSALEDFRYSRRIPNRAAAALQLLIKGLECSKKEEEKKEDEE